MSSVISISSIFPILFLVIGICTFLSTYHLNLAGLSVIRDLRAELFSHIQRLPLAFFQTKKTGDLIARLTADTQAMQYALTITGRDLAIAPLTLAPLALAPLATPLLFQALIFQRCSPHRGSPRRGCPHR